MGAPEGRVKSRSCGTGSSESESEGRGGGWPCPANPSLPSGPPTSLSDCRSQKTRLLSPRLGLHLNGSVLSSVFNRGRPLARLLANGFTFS